METLGCWSGGWVGGLVERGCLGDETPGEAGWNFATCFPNHSHYPSVSKQGSHRIFVIVIFVWQP